MYWNLFHYDWPQAEIEVGLWNRFLWLWRCWSHTHWSSWEAAKTLLDIRTVSNRTMMRNWKRVRNKQIDSKMSLSTTMTRTSIRIARWHQQRRTRKWHVVLVRRRREAYWYRHRRSRTEDLAETTGAVGKVSLRDSIKVVDVTGLKDRWQKLQKQKDHINDVEKADYAAARICWRSWRSRGSIRSYRLFLWMFRGSWWNESTSCERHGNCRRWLLVDVKDSICSVARTGWLLLSASPRQWLVSSNRMVMESKSWTMMHMLCSSSSGDG